MYENIVDPAELYRISEYMINLIDIVPLIDSESYYFKDSYRLQIVALEKEKQVIKFSSDMQM